MLSNRTRKFEWRYMPELVPNPGWRPADTPPDFIPGEPFISAHDTLEHLSDKPDWPHELRAQGVAMFGRVAYEPRILETVVFDIIGFAEQQKQKFFVPTAPAWMQAPLKSKVHEATVLKLRDALQELINESAAKLVKQGCPAEEIAAAKKFPNAALPWLRQGYKNAMRVYGPENGERSAMPSSSFARSLSMILQSNLETCMKATR